MSGGTHAAAGSRWHELAWIGAAVVVWLATMTLVAWGVWATARPAPVRHQPPLRAHTRTAPPPAPAACTPWWCRQ